MSGIYSMTGGPSYTGASRQDLFDSAMNQPLSLTSTLVDQAKGGILESFGLGTAIKDLTTPQGNEAQSLAEPAFGMAAIPIPGAYTLLKNGVQALTDQGQPLTEDAYKGSASYRKDIPWDQGMTDARAAALAASDDAKKVREYYATKRPFASFIGAMAGQALDPVNYIPVFGEAVQAAAIGRFGFIAGRAMVAGADAALNTGIAGAVTSGARGSFGDDVSWQGLISQMATAAMIGGAFGTLHGVFGSRVDPRLRAEAEARLSTLRTVQESRIALNEGLDALKDGNDIKLSPNATEPMARVANEISRTPQAATVRDSAGVAHEIGGGSVPERGLVVANLYENGKTYIGKPGDLHFSVDERYPHSLRGNPVDTGFVTPDGQYLTRAEALAWVNANEKTVKPASNMGGQLDALDYRQQVPSDQKKSAGDLSTNPTKYKGKTVAAVKIGDKIFTGDMHADALDKAVRQFGADSPEIKAFEALGDPLQAIGILEQGRGFRTGISGDRGRSIGENLLESKRKQRMDSVNSPVSIRPIDTTPARPDLPPEGIKQAEASIAKPEDTKNLAEQYRVDPQTGTFPEEADLHQLSAEGRFTEHDAATMAQAQADYETGSSFAEALKSVAGCLI